MDEKPKRLYGLDFIRAVCSLGMVLYHFSAASACPLKILFGNANGNWGEAFVALFFAVSGFSMLYNHYEVNDPAEFYLRRIKSIFPSFWLGYIIIYFIRVIKNVRFFFLDDIASRWSLLLSIPGMDGYFLYKAPNYYLIGEWFLGAIILLYLLYPIILKVFKKAAGLTVTVLSVAFAAIVYNNPFEIVPFRNLLTCILLFMLGMLLCKYKDRLFGSKTALTVSVIMAAVLAFIRLPVNEDICKVLLGICLFLPLNAAGEAICNKSVLKKIVREGSSVSYEVFLLHHAILYKVLEYVNPVSKKKMLVVLFGTLLLIYLSAGFLKVLKNQLTVFRFEKFSDSVSRISELDITKGLGIIAVMLVHLPGDFRLIQDGLTFHLAVFFAVSGITSEKKKYDIRKDAIRILVPYFILSLLFIIYTSVKYYCSGHPEMIAGDASVYLFYTFSFIGCGTLWFLPTLFFSRVINAFTGRLSAKIAASVRIGLLAVGSLLGWILAEHGISGYPQALSVSAFFHNILLVFVQSVIAAGISGLGIIIRDLINKKDSAVRVAGITIAAFIVNFACYPLYDGNNLNCAYIIKPAGFIIGITFGTAAIFGLSKIIKKIPYISSILIYFGINSLIIMTTHLEYGFLNNTVLFTQIVTGNPILQRILPILILCVIEWMICLIVNATPLIKIFRPDTKLEFLKQKR
ncbi:MAG: acyltransferase family protein [Lachnospiraceae bacterium]|nr:acyltransferase family protein [Lachnospiraceae bacterium]